jgi:predicted O-methyltransferase YrrM
MRRILGRTFWNLFPFFESLGIHMLPVHYYSPIPDTRELRRNQHLFDVEHPMYGINMRGDEQLRLCMEVIKPLEEEYMEEMGENYTDPMISFAPLNALILYAIVRQFKPKKMLEVGSGMSTQVSATAFSRNRLEGNLGELIAIEPYPSVQLQNGYEGLSDVIRKRVQDVDVGLFLDLQENDILFIDSTHTVRIFGDVNYLYLTVLPQLAPGVVIHIHDIFFPVDYRPHHFLNKGPRQIWQEQYLLQAFLMFNQEFEVLLSSSYVHFKHLDELQRIFPWYDGKRWPSSFWMKRKT